MPAQALTVTERHPSAKGRKRFFTFSLSVSFGDKPEGASQKDWASFHEAVTLFAIYQEAETQAHKKWAGEPEYDLTDSSNEPLSGSNQTTDSLQQQWCVLHQTRENKAGIEQAMTTLKSQGRWQLGLLGSGAILSIPGMTMFVVGIVAPAINAQALSMSFGIPGLVVFLLAVGLMLGSDLCYQRMKTAATEKKGIDKGVSKRSNLWSKCIEIKSEVQDSKRHSRGNGEVKGSAS